MKKILVLLTLTMLTASCVKSREEKAAEFAANSIKKVLNYPDSYEAVETQVDSAFSSVYYDTKACETAYDILEQRKEQESIEEDFRSAKTSVALDAVSFGIASAYQIESLRQSKEKLEKVASELEKVKDKIQEDKDIILARYRAIKQGEFWGWGITQRYRCANGAGDKSINNALLITDTEFKEVYFNYFQDPINPNQLKEIQDVIHEIVSE